MKFGISLFSKKKVAEYDFSRIFSTVAQIFDQFVLKKQKVPKEAQCINEQVYDFLTGHFQ